LTHGCSGGLPLAVMLYAKSEGLNTENEYPYENKKLEGTCRMIPETVPKKYLNGVEATLVGNTKNQPNYNSNTIYAMLKKGPVFTSFDAGSISGYK
jgi:hypothetical protein